MLLIAPGLTYLDREDWGARTNLPRLGRSVPRQHRTHIVLHHPCMVDDDDSPNIWESVGECTLKMRQLQTIRPDLGLDVPYSFCLFLMDGGEILACEGRGLDLTGAHTYAHNTTGIGVTIMGNFDLPVTILDAHISRSNRFFGWLKREEGMVNLAGIHPHQQFSSTGCPGTHLIGIVDRFNYGEEDDMVKMRFVKGPDPTEPEWATDGIHKIGVTGQVKTDLINLGLAEPGDALPVQQAFINSLVDHAADIDAVKVAIAKVGGGGSLTEARFIALQNRTGLKVLD